MALLSCCCGVGSGVGSGVWAAVVAVVSRWWWQAAFTVMVVNVSPVVVWVLIASAALVALMLDGIGVGDVCVLAARDDNIGHG